jgi:hypothetical protein
MTMDNNPEDLGRALAEDGAQRAADHAERVTPNWNERAYALALQYLEPGKEFLTEEARAYATNNGLPPAPDSRAWGHVIKRLSKDGRVVPCGTAQSRNASAHKGFVTLWRAV